MPTIKLNERTIRGLSNDTLKDVLYWDTDLKGFGVRVSGKTKAKVYVVQGTLPRVGNKRPRSPRPRIGPTNAMSLEKAKARAADLLDDIRRGIDPNKKAALAPTLQSWLESYLIFRKDLRPGTVRMYRTIERTLKPWMNLQLHEISGEMVEARHRELASIIGGQKTRYTGKATANFAMKALRAIWNFANDRVADLPRNPVNQLKRGMFPEPRRERYVSAEQLPAFYRAVMDLDNTVARDYILLMLFTGLRRYEALSLRWDYIDLKEGLIRLPATATKAKRKLDLPLSGFVFDLLVERRKLGNAGGFVFPGRSANEHLTANIKSWKMIEKATGIKVSAHDLRRSYATVAGNVSMPPYALAAMLNHSVGSSVTSGYVIAMPALRDAVQKVADRMKALCGMTEIGGENVKRLRS